jgi:hypothetical protein
MINNTLSKPDYYQRKSQKNADGSPCFYSAEDQANEHETRLILGYLWNCEIKPFGQLSPVDFFAVRNGALVSVLELKTRSHPTNAYPTVYLNVRKWGSLMLYYFGLGCPALFVVRFTDGYRWIDVNQIDASKWKIGGTKKIVKSHTDIEPVILVPIDAMSELSTSQEGVF